MEPNEQDRLTQVESALMHLQHDFESLNDTLLYQQKLINELRKSVEKLTSVVENLDGDEQRDPGEERPPHY